MTQIDIDNFYEVVETSFFNMSHLASFSRRGLVPNRSYENEFSEMGN